MADGLERFVKAQSGTYQTALAELRSGTKRGHWMWFVFPQVAGLGRSETARFYAIRDMAEARAYLGQAVLGSRLRPAQAMLAWAGRRSPSQVLGPVDAAKLRSSLTLFEAAGGGDLYARALDALYGGERDPLTLARL